MTDPQISRDVVETAARVLVDGGAVPGKSWDELQPSAQFAWAQRMRKALRAVAPLIVAEAYEHRAQQIHAELQEEFEDLGPIQGPAAEEAMDQAKTLRRLAAELRAQS